ncbi:hypothetical protein [Tuwongella immobilis]|uniref:Signal peptide protein: Uncharacterized protein n=1 Tax=Tuwongella immobilis TaxID=692036 RepID=A0A6C2YN97_9BACT|nr:hypothetical protein [Tuwongella immobilis]VIP02854.1 signal peptide protein : Uncharacterized protein OS=Rhodopirellula baltica SH28 GN=RBSH_03789 PE=4 SV=1 [Tuwongella immobilis]VTS02650.1 signal peptide protein : Uncharacterized protein OS=Rhodopirellula baltica SH28 GN=RBSH_03789 PE=4 SV=1 [Tuwongella immobilis]
MNRSFAWLLSLLGLLTCPIVANGETVIRCEGTYPKHLQGVALDRDALYWSFTTKLVKTDRAGKKLQERDVVDHHGDLCLHRGELLVAVNLGKFNDPQGNADNWIYRYRAADLQFLGKIAIPQVKYGAGGIGVRENRFVVVGGLAPGIDHNLVYEYDSEWKFQKAHRITSGYTLMGIQTATFAGGRWYFGCYGKPPMLLIANERFELLGKFEFDASLGIVGDDSGSLWIASGRCNGAAGCEGSIRRFQPTQSGPPRVDSPREAPPKR